MSETSLQTGPRLLARRVREFVRDTLGCGCPEAVLRSIRWWWGPFCGCDPDLILRIDVGGRLLVELVTPGDRGPDPDRLRALLEEGRRRRDSCGFNRFRLVLVVAEPGFLVARLSECYPDLPDVAERLHLHLVARELVEGLLPLPGPREGR